ncbi:hypothetical protein BC628DRAFT_1387404 [Trametes gibbosa]|nr:hypothetical protein BC628DRAFT_1387404 [Trametes gibbosa]
MGADPRSSQTQTVCSLVALFLLVAVRCCEGRLDVLYKSLLHRSLISRSLSAPRPRIFFVQDHSPLLFLSVPKRDLPLSSVYPWAICPESKTIVHRS